MFHLKNIHYRYVRDDSGDGARIRGVQIDELKIENKGVTAVIGPSGSGKTTLLSILAGFLRPTKGSDESFCLFDGKDYAAHGHAVGDVAFVFQSPMLLNSANAAVNMLQGRVVKASAARIDDVELDRIRNVTADLGLLASGDHLLHKRAKNLSGGEKQRVAILRALIADPKAVLCDEPTSSLDDHNAQQALNALHRWSEDRTRPVIWITHNMDQAARWADHYIFMSRGRIHSPSDAQRKRLACSDPATRLEALREVVDTLSNGGRSDTTPVEKGHDAIPFTLGRLRYARWIAHALSTDASSGGLSSLDGDSGLKIPAWPKHQTGLLRRLDGSTPPPPSGPARLWRALFGYTGYGTAMIVFVLMSQIFAANLGQSLARDYSDTRLQDPSVARVVFDHFVFGQDDAGPQPIELYPGAPMESLESEIRAEISSRTPNVDASRVSIFGRRVIDGSALRFQSGNAKCAGRWYPSANDTVALSIDDPILNQTEFAAGDPRLQTNLPAVRAYADTLSPAIGADIPLLLLDRILFDRLQEYCEFASDEPIRALWAVGDVGKLTPIEVEIAGAITKFPPLYPLRPEIIVFEHGYQQAMNRLDAGRPGPFRVATAYIPIEGFGPAAEVIRDRGYRVRDDSSAAVQTLQGVARAADTLPRWIIAFNILGAAILVLIVLDNVLTLNKSVLALFVAHGYKKRDILAIMVLHLLPAIAAAGLALVILAFLGSAFVADMTPSSAADVAAFTNKAFAWTVAIVVATWLLVSLAVVPWWWNRTRSRLKSYLQE